jgi:hypothetical protein
MRKRNEKGEECRLLLPFTTLSILTFNNLHCHSIFIGSGDLLIFSFSNSLISFFPLFNYLFIFIFIFIYFYFYFLKYNITIHFFFFFFLLLTFAYRKGKV